MRNFLFLLFISFSFDAAACSAFFYNSSSKVLAKNFDWSSGEGYLLKNNRGKQNTLTVSEAATLPAGFPNTGPSHLTRSARSFRMAESTKKDW